MDTIRDYISWGVIIVGCITGIGFLIRYLIQKKIDSYFNKKLETYKQELAIITENAKYDISKKLYDFEAYASKKHVVYPELYSRTFEIRTELLAFISKTNREDKMILDRDTLDRRFFEGLILLTNKIDTVYEYFYKNELYLSKNAAIAYEDAMYTNFGVLQKIAVNFQENIDKDNWQDSDFLLINFDDKDYDKVADKVRLLKETIYKELSYTHFEEMEKIRGPVVVTEPLFFYIFLNSYILFCLQYEQFSRGCSESNSFSYCFGYNHSDPHRRQTTFMYFVLS